MPANDTPTTSFPQTKWAQQPSQILLTIAVPDIDNVNVKFEEENVHFHGKTTDKTNPITYELKIDLYGKIDAEQSKYEVAGQKFWKLILKKKEPGSPFWPRLTKDTKKLHWLSVDFDHWIDEDGSDEEHAGPGGMGGGNFQDMFSGGMPGMGGMGGYDDEDLEGDDEHSGDELDDDKMPMNKKNDEEEKHGDTISASTTETNSTNNNNVGEHGEAGLKQRAQGTKSTSNKGHESTTADDVNTDTSSKEHMA